MEVAVMLVAQAAIKETAECPVLWAGMKGRGICFSDIHSFDGQLLLSKRKALHLEWSIEYDTVLAAGDTFLDQLISYNLEGVDSHQVI